MPCYQASSRRNRSGTGAFMPAGKLAEGRVYHTAAALPDGRVLAVGGAVQDEAGPAATSSAEVWEPITTQTRG